MSNPTDDSSGTAPESHDLAEFWASFAEALKAKQAEYEAFVEAITDSPSRPRAVQWLTYVADHIETFGDQEALVCLRSRQVDCVAQTNTLVQSWKRSAAVTVRDAARGIPVYSL